LVRKETFVLPRKPDHRVSVKRGGGGGREPSNLGNTGKKTGVLKEVTPAFLTGGKMVTETVGGGPFGVGARSEDGGIIAH